MFNTVLIHKFLNVTKLVEAFNKPLWGPSLGGHCENFANLRWQLYYASFNCADHLKLCVNSKFGRDWAGRCCWNSEIRFKLVNNSP